MRIGIDFDNTLVSYDTLFHRVALERQLIPAGLPPAKLAVRDYLRQAGHEDAWTEMQGHVYGLRMADAVAYPGALDFLAWARGEGIDVAIVSHKTRHPFLGPPHDLHAAARGWIDSVLIERPDPVISESDVYFELTMQDKLSRIAWLDLDWFIDDLLDVMLAEQFPRRTSAMLFDPDGMHPQAPLPTFRSWDHIRGHVQNAWTTRG